MWAGPDRRHRPARRPMAARSTQVTSGLRTAVGALLVPRVARATETESGVEVLGFAPIKAVFFALLAGWLLANAARLTVALLELLRLLFMILAPIGRCCRGRRVSPAEAPILQATIGAAYPKPALQGTTRCLGTCNTCPAIFSARTCLECKFPQVIYPSAAPSADPGQSAVRLPRARMVRNVATQSQCTYSSVAKAPRPQFKGVSGFTGMVEHSPVYILVEIIDDAAL